jgi:hypothetical protein
MEPTKKPISKRLRRLTHDSFVAAVEMLLNERGAEQQTSGDYPWSIQTRFGRLDLNFAESPDGGPGRVFGLFADAYAAGTAHWDHFYGATSGLREAFVDFRDRLDALLPEAPKENQ